MSGRCYLCRAKTQALPGPANKVKRHRPLFGMRPGWVIEKSSASYLICNVCAFRALTTPA